VTTTEGVPAVLSSVRDFLSRPKRLFIDGRWVEAASGRTFPTFDPATGEELCAVAHGQAEDVDRAVAAARRAFEDGPWVRMKPSDREQLIWRIGDLIDERAEEFAQLESLDNGKPVTVAKHGDAAWSADIFRYYAGWASKIEGSTTNVSMPFAHGPAEYHAYTLREPVGVCGLIVPWNLPLVMASLKLAPALAAGNTMVLKPAEQTPLTALLLGELLAELDLPPGVVNIVTGFGDAGRRSRPTTTSTRSRSPGRPRSARRSSMHPGGTSRRSRSNSAGRARTSCSPTQTSSARFRSRCAGGSSTRARTAPRAPDSTCRSRSSTSSPRRWPSASARSPWAPASIRAPSWGPWCRRSSSTG
jgi:hypothetical protein